MSLLPLRGTLTDRTTLTDAVRATRDTLFAADARQHVDLDALSAARHPDPGNPRPLVTVSADLDTAPLTSLALPGLRATPLDGGTQSAPLELALMATRLPDGDLDLRLRHDADLFDEATARGYLDRLENVLAAMTAGAAETVGDLTPGSSPRAPPTAPTASAPSGSTRSARSVISLRTPTSSNSGGTGSARDQTGEPGPGQLRRGIPLRRTSSPTPRWGR